MAECLKCKKNGWFLGLKGGVCKDCWLGFKVEVEALNQGIDEAAEIISRTKKLDGRVEQHAAIIDHLNTLVEYEKKGIDLRGTKGSHAGQKPSEILAWHLQAFDDDISETLAKEVEAVKSKVEVEPSAAKKLGALTKMRARLRELRDRVWNQAVIEPFDKSLAESFHEIQVNAFLDAAKKAEFKGQSAKALDQYQEALYYLQNNDVPKSLKARVAELEKKIQGLGPEA